MKQLLQKALDYQYHKHFTAVIYNEAKTLPDAALELLSPDPLTILHPFDHSILYFLILTQRLLRNTINLSFVYQFAAHFNPEIATVLSSSDVHQFVNALLEKAFSPTTKLAVIGIFNLFCQKFSPGLFTPFHAPLLQLCLETKAFSAALSVLDRELIDFSKKIPITTQDFLLYHYYGGLIYTGLKKFPQASAFFQMAINVPAQIASCIQIESCKRLVLLDLIQEGKVSGLPIHMPSSVSKLIRQGAQMYFNFGSVYETSDYHKISEFLLKDEQQFVADECWGLVKQSVVAFFTRKIVQLTQSYITLSLDDILAEIGEQSVQIVGETEDHILKMIQMGQIEATISHKDNGMVSFQDTNLEFHGSEIAQALGVEIDTLIDLSRKMEEMNREAGLSKEYIGRNKERSGYFQGSFHVDEDIDDDMMYM
jgi:COP9 signalosome complex subunit 3